MSKRDLENMVTLTPEETGATTGKNFEGIEKGATDNQDRQGKASPEEIKERQARRATSGRKGCKMHRIALAVTDEEKEYIRIMSLARGEYYSTFIDSVLKEYYENHKDIYEESKALVAKMEKEREAAKK